jgi:hypothetical protein
MLSLSIITSVVSFVGLKGLICAVAGSVVTVTVPKVAAFMTKQTKSVEAKAAPVVAKAEAAVAQIATSAVANTVEAAIVSVEKKL